MKTKAVPFSWIRRAGIRLDAGPFLGGALEARMLLEQGRLKTEPLRKLTKGHNGGIFNGPMFSRNYVKPEYGVPFVGSSDMLMADLTNLPYLRRKDAESAKLAFLRLQPGMTLISCSGTIGRTVYVRQDMAHMWSSQHIMKVVPNPDAIRSGFLYAFLSSRFGVAMITSGTYGAIIQHIEAEHIADLPVPRLGETIERNVHELVEKAAKLRTQASVELAAGIVELEKLAGLPGLPQANTPYPFSVRSVSTKKLLTRLDAFFHSDYHQAAVAAVRGSKVGPTTVAEVSDSVVEPIRFKRTKIDDKEHGIPFFGTSTIFWCDPVPNYLIPKAQQGIKQYIVERKTLLMPRSGQLAGIIGNVVLPYGAVVGGAVTEDAIRINCPDETTAGFLFLALSSVYGIRQLKARAYGSSIPHLDVNNIRAVIVPDLSSEARRKLGTVGVQIAILRDEAIKLDRQARELVENAIEEAA